MSEGGNSIENGSLSPRDQELMRPKSPEGPSNVESVMDSIRSRPENDRTEAEDVGSNTKTALYDLITLIHADQTDQEGKNKKDKPPAPADNLDLPKDKLVELKDTALDIAANQRVNRTSWDQLMLYVDSNMHRWGTAVINGPKHDEATAQAYQRIYGSIRRQMYERTSLIEGKKDEYNEFLEPASPYPEFTYKPTDATKILEGLSGRTEVSFEVMQQFIDAVKNDLEALQKDPKLEKLAQAVKAARKVVDDNKGKTQEKMIIVSVSDKGVEAKLKEATPDQKADPQNGHYLFTPSANIYDPLSLGHNEYMVHLPQAQQKDLELSTETLRKLQSKSTFTLEDELSVYRPIDLYRNSLTGKDDKVSQGYKATLKKMEDFVKKQAGDPKERIKQSRPKQTGVPLAA